MRGMWRQALLAAGTCIALAGAASAIDIVYTYDALGRVKTVLYPAYGTTPAKLITYTYDAAGNRTAVATTVPPP